MKSLGRLSFALLLVLAAPAWAATPQETFISNLGQHVVTMLGDAKVSIANRHAEFAKLFTSNFDLDKIGRFVLGRHWNEATDAQQAEYQSLFKKMVISVYTQRFDGYAGQKFTVKGSTPVDGVDTDVMVHSQIEQTDGQAPIDVDWRVRTTGGTNKIIDVMVSGVSMSVTQRGDFDGVIQQSGVDGLIQDMKTRIASGTTAPVATKAKGKKAVAAPAPVDTDAQ